MIFALLLLVQDVKLSIEERDGAWQFVVSGTAPVSDGATLKARVYALEEVVDPRGAVRMDEEPLGPAVELTAERGRFRAVAFEARRRPYSLPYLARVVRDDEVVGTSTLRRGTAGLFATELADTRRELAAELVAVQRLFREFGERFAAQQKKRDDGAWGAWADPWFRRVQDLADRNEDRWCLWAVWMERQGKFRIESFCDRLRSMLAAATDALDGDEDAIEDLRRATVTFTAYVDDARDVIGVETPADPDLVAAHLDRLVAATSDLRTLFAASDRAGWAERSEPIRRDARAALLALSPQSVIPRRGYARVASLARRFIDLWSLADRTLGGDAGAGNRERLQRARESLRRGLAEFDGDVADFRAWAGIR